MEKAGRSHAKRKQVVLNQAKWEAATDYCKDRMLEFKVLTENELGIK